MAPATSVASPSATTNSILLGAIAVVNSAGVRQQEKDDFISLLAQLLHCPAAPPPATASILSSRQRSGSTATLTPAAAATPVPAPASATAYAASSTTDRKPSTTSGLSAGGNPGNHGSCGQSHLLPTLLPPTPPLSPTELALDALPPSSCPEQNSESLPLPLATCLTQNRSHSISAAGLETATECAERYDVPRESILLIGVAHVLRSYYSGQKRRGPTGRAKDEGNLARMEGCTACGCLDFDLAIGLLGEEGSKEECGCGHGYEAHTAWEWQPASSQDCSISPGQRDSKRDQDSARQKPRVTRQSRTPAIKEASFAQTADDSRLFETDDDESQASSCVPSRDASPSPLGSPSPTSLSFPAHGPSPYSTASRLLSSLPTASSPGLEQVVKRFAYWTIWTYSSLAHLSSVGQPKVSHLEIRECSEPGCSCADFYMDTKWLRRRSRRLSRESLRSLGSLSRRQSLSLSVASTDTIQAGGDPGAYNSSYGAYGPTSGRRSTTRPDDACSTISSTTPRYPIAERSGAGSSYSGSGVATPSAQQERERLYKQYQSQKRLQDRHSDANTRPSSRLSTATTNTLTPAEITGQEQECERPPSRASSFRSVRPYTSSHTQHPHGLHRPSSRASLRSEASAYSSYPGRSSASSIHRAPKYTVEEPHAKCACGHASSAHRYPGGAAADLSWVLIEWGYVALSRLGAGNLLAYGSGEGGQSVGPLEWPLCEDGGREEELWRRGRPVRA